jgi:cytosine/adenosine deaminase-related metal-dependent hydrolase
MTPRPCLLLPDGVIPGRRADGATLDGHGIAVLGAEIVAIETHGELRRRYPDAERIELPGTIVMPGLVNAHQHGRLVSSVQLGALDDLLEIYMNRNRARIRPLDAVLLRAHARDVALTMIDGRVVYRDGRHLTLDVEALRARAAEQLERATASCTPEVAEQFAVAADRFYRPRVALDALAPHWRPLALDRRTCH